MTNLKRMRFFFLTDHPAKILGLVPLGTSMDCESADSRTKGCW